MNTRIALLLAPLFFLSAGFNTAHAGFGITPPYVRNDSLTRNSSYEQTIILSRSDPTDDLNVSVIVDLPEANDWIRIDKGFNFVMHKGENVLPMTVTVNVPKKAKFKGYEGNIRVVISPLGGPTPGTVGIALGAQIDVDIDVVDKKIYDFNVRGVQVTPLEEGHKKWGLFFPGKIRFTMQVENTGNVKFGPTKVVFELKNTSDGSVVERTESVGGIEQIEPFLIKNIIAEIPTRVKAGSYKAIFSIYSNEKIVRQGELDLSVLPFGAIPGYKGFGFSGLTRQEQMIIIGGALAVLIVVLLIIGMIYRFVRRKARS